VLGAAGLLHPNLPPAAPHSLAGELYGVRPWIGVWERLNISVFKIRVIVLAIALLQVRETYGMRALKPIAAS
jgi:hypothetical protein